MMNNIIKNIIQIAKDDIDSAGVGMENTTVDLYYELLRRLGEDDAANEVYDYYVEGITEYE